MCSSTQRGALGLRCSYLLLLAFVAIATANSASAAPGCPAVRVCLAIDGSGSISSSNFDLIKTGLANAVRDGSIVPRTGAVELSFVQFGSGVRTEVSPVIIT